MRKSLSISDKILLFPLWLMSLLPLSVLYLFSDFLFVIIFYIIPYRKKLVIKNIRNSFPEKEEKEILLISRRFYRYLCDYFIESIYLINMSIEECNRRYVYKNPELLQNLYEEKKNLIIATSHFGNWEWATNYEYWFPQKLYGIYKPLANKVFDRLFIKIRGKYGSEPIPMKHTLRTIVNCIKKKEIFALYFVADQRPLKQEISYWTTFMNQKAPVITGMDKLARKYNLSVVFMDITRTRRGYYEVKHELIVSQPELTKPNEIAEKYMRSVETLIRKQPENYLWSHNRWKYKAEDFIPGEVK